MTKSVFWYSSILYMVVMVRCPVFKLVTRTRVYQVPQCVPYLYCGTRTIWNIHSPIRTPADKPTLTAEIMSTFIFIVELEIKKKPLCYLCLNKNEVDSKTKIWSTTSLQVFTFFFCCIVYRLFWYGMNKILCGTLARYTSSIVFLFMLNIYAALY